MRSFFTTAGAALFAATLAATAGSAQADTSTLYETFGNVLYSLDFKSQTELGSYNGNAANLTAVNGDIYWQDGVNIDEANPNLTGIKTIWTNLDAPTDFALDSAGDTLYETFDSTLYALNLKNDSELASYNGTATNLTAVNGHIYWQDGVNIEEANPDLTDVKTIWANLGTPTDFTLDSTGDTLYETFGSELYTLNLKNDTEVASYNGTAANLVAANGYIYWQDGIDIEQANPNLTGVTTIWTNLDAPTDFTIEDVSSAVPEMSTWAMMLLGFTGVGFAACRKALAARADLIA